MPAFQTEIVLVPYTDRFLMTWIFMREKERGGKKRKKQESRSAGSRRLPGSCQMPRWNRALEVGRWAFGCWRPFLDGHSQRPAGQEGSFQRTGQDRIQKARWRRRDEKAEVEAEAEAEAEKRSKAKQDEDSRET